MTNYNFLNKSLKTYTPSNKQVGNLVSLRGRKSNENTLVQTIVVLLKNTTWRCGRLERAIVQHLYKRHTNFKSPSTTIKELMINLNIAAEKKEEYLDAIRRLEKRNIVKIIPLKNYTPQNILPN